MNYTSELKKDECSKFGDLFYDDKKLNLFTYSAGIYWTNVYSVAGAEATSRTGIHLESTRKGNILLLWHPMLNILTTTLGDISEKIDKNPCPHAEGTTWIKWVSKLEGNRAVEKING